MREQDTQQDASDAKSEVDDTKRSYETAYSRWQELLYSEATDEECATAEQHYRVLLAIHGTAVLNWVDKHSACVTAGRVPRYA